MAIMQMITSILRVQPAAVEQVLGALSSAGYDGRAVPGWVEADGRQYVEVRGIVLADPTIEAQVAAHAAVLEVARAVAGDAGVEQAGNGVVVAGGTSLHRWLEVTVDGQPAGLKIIAVDDHDVDRELAQVAESMQIARSRLDVVRPDPWPQI